MTYDAIHSNHNNRGRNKSQEPKIRDVVSPKVPLETANIVEKAMTEVIVQHLVKNVPNVVERTISSLYVKVVQMINETKVGLGLKSTKKGKKFHEIDESENNKNTNPLVLIAHKF